MKKILLLLSMAYLAGCTSDDNGGTLFVKATETGIDFENAFPIQKTSTSSLTGTFITVLELPQAILITMD
jgi:hypothetical protein